MVCCGFIFDFIVVRVDVPSVQIENNKLLQVDANFNNIKLKITSSRINVVEFKPRRSFEFDIPPEQLRSELAKNPLKLKVFYDSQVIGVASIPWSSNVLEKISKNMGEVTEIDDCELLAEDSEERVGVLEFVCRLQCKCEESSEECQDITNCDLKRQISKVIDPHDILFIVAEPTKQNDCDVPLMDDVKLNCASNLVPSTGFDLSPYRFLNGRTVHNSEAINTCHNLDCCELMRTADPCQCLHDAMSRRPRSTNCKRHVRTPSHKLPQNCSTCQQSSQRFSRAHYTNNFLAAPASSLPRSCPVCPPSMPLPEVTIEDFPNSKNLSVCNMTAEEILKEFCRNNE